MTRIRAVLIAWLLTVFYLGNMADAQSDKYAEMDLVSERSPLPIENALVTPLQVELETAAFVFKKELGYQLNGWFIRSRGTTRTIFLFG